MTTQVPGLMAVTQQPLPNTVVRTQHSKNTDLVAPPDWGVAVSSAVDSTVALCLMLNSLPDNCMVDFGGRDYRIFTGVVPVNYPADAVPLASVPRLYNKKNITLKNGRIFVDSPGVNPNPVSQNFPTTFTVDGCEGIHFENFHFVSKGEKYGDVDASQPLGIEARRAYMAQNGGHACAVIRSKNVTFDSSCSFRLAGSCGTFYNSSSTDVVLNGAFANPKSLGYASYAFDTWCGGPEVFGIPALIMTLNNCNTWAEDAPNGWGNKGGVVIEGPGVVCNVNGGVYKDSFANGGAPDIGGAFSCANGELYVNGSRVDNCASVGYTAHSVEGNSILKTNAVIATNMRNSMHINARNPFGTSIVLHKGLIGTYGPAPAAIPGAPVELSLQTVVTNLKLVSTFHCDFEDCTVIGADRFSWNERGCYGGIRVIGGYYELLNYIFMSKGWGGSAAGTNRGFQTFGPKFLILSPNNAGQISQIVNNDGQGVITQLLVDMDASTTIESKFFRIAESLIDTTLIVVGQTPYGTPDPLGAVTERLLLFAVLINCGSLRGRLGVGYLQVKNLLGIFGGNYKIQATFPFGTLPATASMLIDDGSQLRRIVGWAAGPAIVAGKLEADIFLSGTTNQLAIGGVFTLT